MVIIQVLGLVLVVWSIIMFVRMNQQTHSYVFNFADGAFEFDIEFPGVYSIAVLGAGFVGKLELVDVQLEVNNSDLIKTARYIISPRFRNGTHMGTGCWYFTAESQGHYKLSLSNLKAVEAKESMLISRRIFQDPINGSNLNIMVYKSIKPLYQFLSFVGFPLGLYMVGVGFV